MKLNYREDIDGIRAIAVLAIILYHFDIRFFSGGYVGVDIFFVISGYLITSIIIRDVNEKEFSLLKFYDRRIRRIFPALFTVLLATTITAWFLFGAKEFKDFGYSLIGTILFVSNFFFWSQAGYFDAPSVLKPLLHTWSLAVEEQYYIFFPILLVFLTRYAKSKLKFILLCIAVISFSVSVYSLGTDANSTFYLLHTRIWELLIGSLLATKILPIVGNLRLRNVLGVLGLVMLSLPIFFYTSDTPFPASAALLPTLGTGLVIYSGVENETKTIVAKILGFKPIVFIGKISYSLYLWHWPIIVFVKYYLILGLDIMQTVVTLLSVFILATLSWKFVETPLRLRTRLAGRQIFVAATLAMIVTIACGSAVYVYDGFPQRFAEQKTTTTSATVQCHIAQLQDDAYVLNSCLVGKQTSEPEFLLMGDSHAGRIATAVKVSALKAGVGVVVAYKTTCPLLLGTGLLFSTCNEYIDVMLNYIRKHPNIKTVILSCRWASYAEGSSYKSEDHSNQWIYPGYSVHPDEAQRAIFNKLFATGLNKMVGKLLSMNRKVVIVSQVPEVGYNVPAALSIAERTGRDVNEIIAPTLDEYLNRNKHVIPVLNSLEKKENVHIVDPWKILCNQKKCQVTINDIPLYTDDDHLSNFGAEYIASIFDSVFGNIPNQ